MAVSTLRMRRNIDRTLPAIGGGGLGVAAPAALREFADVQDGQQFSLLGQPGSTIGRLTRPSVAWGLGMGSLTGLLWWADAGPSMLEDFYLAHTVTAIPAGAASAALPVEAPSSGGGGGGSAQTVSPPRETRPSTNDFASADGTSPDTQPAN